jgi:hypothetical protein
MWKQWFRKFWWVHGEIVIYGTVSTIFGVSFICLGSKCSTLSDLKGAGMTILVGVAMYVFKKMQGNGKEPLKSEEKKE